MVKFWSSIFKLKIIEKVRNFERNKITIKVLFTFKRIQLKHNCYWKTSVQLHLISDVKHIYSKFCIQILYSWVYDVNSYSVMSNKCQIQVTFINSNAWINSVKNSQKGLTSYNFHPNFVIHDEHFIILWTFFANILMLIN